MTTAPQPESAFTAPRPDCPNPQWWHADDPEAVEVEVRALLAALVRALQPDIVVETGTYTGHTAYHLGTALAANGHGHLHTVEIDPDRAAQATALCAGLPVTVHIGRALDWRPPGPVGMAFFDSHPDDRAAEARAYAPALAAGAVLLFHDTGPQHVVRPGVEALHADRLISEPLWLPTPRGLAVAAFRGGPQ